MSLYRFPLEDLRKHDDSEEIPEIAKTLSFGTCFSIVL